MTYATQQNMIDRFGQPELIELTDRASLGSIDTTVLNGALTDADGEVNGYLATRYTLPLAPVPVVLTRLACDIARYFLYEDRATEAVRTRYQDAIKFLRGVSDGTITLGVDATNGAPAESGGAQFDAGPRVFTRRRSDGAAGSLDDYA